MVVRKIFFWGCLCAGLIFAPPLKAWDGPTHAAIVRLALQDAPQLSRPLPVESLADYLAGTRYKTVASFISTLHLNPGASFPLRLPGEKPGGLAAAGDILQAYAVEPDWGMDVNVCVAYPGFCGKEYEFMGAFTPGLASQGFRHMYWPGGYLKLLTEHIPIPVHVDKPLGQAQDRCQLFFDLSLEAAQTGHPYWAARFLAWSLHYAQDLTLPYHASQLPSPKLKYFSHYLPSAKLTIKKVTYYHLAFELYLNMLVEGNSRLGPLGEKVTGSLRRSISGAEGLRQGTARDIAKAAALYSSQVARRSADASLTYFPKIDVKDTDPEGYLESKEFDQAVTDRFRTGPLLDEFVGVAGKCLTEAGAVTKTMLAIHQKELSVRAERFSAPRLVIPSEKMNRMMESIMKGLPRSLAP